MPCYDPGPSSHVETRTVYESGISPYDFTVVKKRNEWLEAALCAVFNELERRDIAPDVMAEASRNGLIGLMDFWSKHTKADEAKMARDLHVYSKDEQAILRKLLNSNSL